MSVDPVRVVQNILKDFRARRRRKRVERFLDEHSRIIEELAKY